MLRKAWRKLEHKGRWRLHRQPEVTSSRARQAEALLQDLTCNTLHQISSVRQPFLTGPLSRMKDCRTCEVWQPIF